jgi:NAD dependent epimerase/dehydratase family enzyme
MMAGEMADELLLASRRLNPKAALATGYQFLFPTLESALFHQLGIKPGRKTA